ncbi:3-oxoacyl-[acyl-carrier-protein] reductase [Subdoligranulum sp. DSM 109015]|uniref:3-oxoacyl-[acyl-carrier-protein] reductase n=2 Tax=Gemmiger gallinarum TaxID=2779354 RepID=A0ABR9QZ97_9FIRM|nr:3-oxoacyl-[acyl-carrier-protein] reductase [Gemmiger gallinarum]
MVPDRRVAVVTGGSRGIGRAVCVRLAKAGYDICLNYAGNAAAAEETAALCREAGAQVLTVQADVSSTQGCTDLFDAVKKQFGRVDVLVNNAGITRDGLLLRMSEADYDAVLGTNLKGAVFCCKAASRMMMHQRYGRIINMTSVVGLRGNAGQVNYAASKAGLIGLTKSLAKELASRNITVNAVAPGFVGTEMTAAMPEAARTAALATIPAGRMADPDEIARAVEFFAAEGSSYITGQVLCVDGGMAV